MMAILLKTKIKVLFSRKQNWSYTFVQEEHNAKSVGLNK